MKETNENQLLSWQPRQPSAGLKERILALTTDADVPTARWLWSCMAPAMACVLLTLMALDHDGSGLKSGIPVASILSNQDDAVFAAGGVQTKENHLAAVTFGWTNDSVFRSSIRFTPTTNLTN